MGQAVQESEAIVKRSDVFITYVLFSELARLCS